MGDKDDRSWLDRKDSSDKPSWREMDAKRNKSRHVASEPQQQQQQNSFQVRRENSQAKAALNNLFSGKKTKEQQNHWKKVLEGKGKTFSSSADRFVQEFGLPPEWDDLIRLLDHDQPAFVTRVLDRMMERASLETEIRRDLLIGKLRVLKMERDEQELITRFESALEQLSRVPA